MAALRARHLFDVQGLRDFLGRDPAGVILEDPADDPCLGRIDPAVAADRFAVLAILRHGLVAIGQPARRLASQRPALEASMRLLAQFFQKQRVHRAREADMQLRDLALADRLDHHALELQLLIKPGDIGLVARQAIQRLGDDDLEPARLRIAHQLLDACPHQAGARDGAVGIDLDHLQPLARGMIAAGSDLVVDRGVALQVRGEPRIDRGAKGRFTHLGLRFMMLSAVDGLLPYDRPGRLGAQGRG